MMAVAFLDMSSVPPTAETWLAEILLSDQTACSLSGRGPYRHHKDHIAQLEPIFAALSGTVPFGGLSKLSQAVHISDSTLSHWKKLPKVDPSWRPSRRASAHPAEFSPIYKKPSCKEFKPLTLIEAFTLATKTFAMIHKFFVK
jgi:hypothetical protein